MHSTYVPPDRSKGLPPRRSDGRIMPFVKLIARVGRFRFNFKKQQSNLSSCYSFPTLTVALLSTLFSLFAAVSHERGNA